MGILPKNRLWKAGSAFDDDYIQFNSFWFCPGRVGVNDTFVPLLIVGRGARQRDRFLHLLEFVSVYRAYVQNKTMLKGKPDWLTQKQEKTILG